MRSSTATGRLNFGLVGDFNAPRDLEHLAGDVGAALQELVEVAGVGTHVRDMPWVERAVAQSIRVSSR